MAKSNKTPASDTASKAVAKGPAPKAKSGFLAKLESLAKRVDLDALAEAVSNTKSGGRRELPDGDYVMKIISTDVDISENKDGSESMYAEITWLITDCPDGCNLEQSEYKRRFWLTIREDRDGKPVCYDAATLRSMASALTGEEYSTDLDSDTIQQILEDALGDKAIGTEWNVEAKTSEKNGKTYSNFYVHELITDESAE